MGMSELSAYVCASDLGTALARLRTSLRSVGRVAVSAAEKRDYEAVFLACQVGVCRAGLKPKPSNRHLGLLPHHPAAHRTRFRVTAAKPVSIPQFDEPHLALRTHRVNKSLNQRLIGRRR